MASENFAFSASSTGEATSAARLTFGASAGRGAAGTGAAAGAAFSCSGGTGGPGGVEGGFSSSVRFGLRTRRGAGCQAVWARLAGVQVQEGAPSQATEVQADFLAMVI